MSTAGIVIYFVLAAALPEEIPASEPGDPDAERAARMQETLYNLVHGPVLGRMRVGMSVIEAGSGRIFYDRRGAALMDPASNQKILATVTALMRLGSAWRFRTELVGPTPGPDGAITGDVVLRGSGDPSLLGADLRKLATDLGRAGVVRINGAVRADVRRIASDEVAAGERSPLRVGRAALVIRVMPGKTNGARPDITLRPEADTFVVRNQATTRSKGGTRLQVTFAASRDRVVVTVSGRISRVSPGVVLRRRPPHQPLYAAALLREALIEAGIEVNGGAVLVAPPHAKRQEEGLLAVHESDPLGVMIRHINKNSDNEYADRLLPAVGAEIYGGGATMAKGVRALREAIAELGLPPGSYVPVNGSGLGHANRITADAMAALLRRIFFDPRFGPEMLQSLSVGGIDGTTRNRFRGSSAAERVRAKTGTLNGKSCLSGLVGDGSDILVFSIFCDGIRGRRLAAVRGAQVMAVNAMMKYVRGIEGPPDDDETEPGVDVERGDDPLELEESEGAGGNVDGPGAAELDALMNKALRGGASPAQAGGKIQP